MRHRSMFLLIEIVHVLTIQTSERLQMRKTQSKFNAKMQINFDSCFDPIFFRYNFFVVSFVDIFYILMYIIFWSLRRIFSS